MVCLIILGSRRWALRPSSKNHNGHRATSAASGRSNTCSAQVDAVLLKSLIKKVEAACLPITSADVQGTRVQRMHFTRNPSGANKMLMS